MLERSSSPQHDGLRLQAMDAGPSSGATSCSADVRKLAAQRLRRPRLKCLKIAKIANLRHSRDYPRSGGASHEHEHIPHRRAGGIRQG
jgi:hypothetical protein